MQNHRLYKLAETEVSYSLENLREDNELAIQLQSRLTQFGLLDKADGIWGQRSERALSNFKQFRGISEPGVAKATAIELIETHPSKLINGWLLDKSWASRTILWMTLHNFHISVKPDEINIVYFRGLDRSGKWNGNKAFVFNDRRTILKVNESSDGLYSPEMIGNWLATCDPGEYYWNYPMNEAGCADIKAWQYQAWSVGYHHDQLALVQSDEVTVLRGSKRQPDTGDFGINQHTVQLGGDYNPGEEVGRWSAGCMVGASRREHDHEFMPMVQADPREQNNPQAYKHWTAVINGDDFLSMFPV